MMILVLMIYCINNIGIREDTFHIHTYIQVTNHRDLRFNILRIFLIPKYCRVRRVGLISQDTCTLAQQSRVLKKKILKYKLHTFVLRFSALIIDLHIHLQSYEVFQEHKEAIIEVSNYPLLDQINVNEYSFSSLN